MKKSLMILVAVVCFGISASAQCGKEIKFYPNWDGFQNYVEIKNVCSSTYYFYLNYSTDGQSKRTSEIRLAPGESYTFVIGTATRYTIGTY